METLEIIQNCERLLLQAIKENDISLLDKILHEDLLFVDPAGQVMNKEMDLANYKSGLVIVDSLEASDQRINVFDRTAIVTTKVAIKGIYLGEPLDRSFQYFRVWKRFEDRWKIIGGSCAAI